MSRLLPIAIIFLFLPCFVSAQSENNLEFEQVSIPGTMTSAMVEDVLQDPLGMLWIGKFMLHRYDGKKFKSFNIIYPDSVFLTGKQITKLYWDKKANRLLIGTYDQGLLQFRYEDNRITRLPSKSGIPIISDIAQTEDGNIWITSFANGLFFLENDTLKQKLKIEGIIQPMALASDKNDLWVGANRSLFLIKKGVIQKSISLQSLLPQWKESIQISALLFDRGFIWIGTERNGVIRIDPVALKVSRVFSPEKVPFYSTIVRIARDQEGFVWIVTRNNGLAIYDPKNDSYRHVFKDQSKPYSLSGDICKSILVDMQGIVWVGANGALNKYDRHKIKFEHYFNKPYDPNSMSDDNVRGLYETNDNKLWAATADGYINLLDRTKNNIEKIKITVPGYDGFITPLSFIPLKNLMLIGTSKGLIQFDPAKKRFSFFEPARKETFEKNTRQLLTDGNDIYVLRAGTLWIYHIADDHFEKLKSADDIVKITCLTVDNNHRLWLGYQSGVAVSDPEKKSFQRIKLEKDPFRPDSSYFMILSIEQKEKAMWVNTFNTGIYILEQDNGLAFKVKKQITLKNGLPDNTVYASLPDDKGNMWLSTNNGLIKFNEPKNSFVHFTEEDGIQGEEFNRLSYLKLRSGEMAFGGVNGINIFYPDSIKIKASSEERTPQIMGVSVFKNIPADDSFEKYFAFINHTSIPAFHYTENNLKFDFFVPDFRESSRYEVFYQLDPLDPTWTRQEGQNPAVYANLKPGKYTFSVKTLNGENKESITHASFVIEPAFWNTWWFLLISMFVVGGLLFTIIKDRVAANINKQRKLEELLRTRTSEIEKSHEELENLNRKKDLIFSILSHDLRSPLTTLKGFLGMIIDNSDAISKDDLKKYAVSIRNSVTNSLDLIDNTLYWSLSQTGSIQCTPTRIALTPVFEKIKGLYHLTAEKKRIQFQIEEVNGMAVLADENMLYVLLRNLVSNAMKFTPEGKSISIGAVHNKQGVEIKIKDEGVGMSEEEIGKIFMLDNPQVKRGTSSERGTGLGLLLCKKFIEANNGKLKIYSKEGHGSEFIVILPYHD
jgi:signal transduction histidine kinase/ligand-binding sensor domain-containing protein